MPRHGRLQLVLILPDGSKSLIPADWTDLVSAGRRAVSMQTATLGSLEDLLHARAVVDALLSRLAAPESENANSAAKKEGSLATKSEPLRPSSQRNLCVGNTGERDQTLAIEILARLIANAAVDSRDQEKRHE